MSIGPISGSSDWYSQSTDSTQRPKPQQPEMTDTASLLGISTSQLSSDLQSGQTLSSLASSDGVSSSDLLSSVESDLSSGAPQGAPTLSGDQLAQMATNMINGTQPSGGPGGAGGPGGPGGSGSGLSGPTMTSTASLLGISSSQLTSDLQSGQTLSSLAASDGVSSSDLLSSVESDITANAPQGASALSSDQLTQFATSLINGQALGGGQQADTGSAYGADGSTSSEDSSGSLYDQYS